MLLERRPPTRAFNGDWGRECLGGRGAFQSDIPEQTLDDFQVSECSGHFGPNAWSWFEAGIGEVEVGCLG